MNFMLLQASSGQTLPLVEEEVPFQNMQIFGKNEVIQSRVLSGPQDHSSNLLD
jgi:hypothetical protein